MSPFSLWIIITIQCVADSLFFSFRSLWTVLRQSTIDSNGLDIVHWPLFHSSSFFLFSCCCCCCFLLPLFVVGCITLIPTPSLPLPRTHTLRMCVQPPSLLSTYNTSPPPLPPLYTHQSLSRNFIMFSFHSPLGLVKRYTPLQYPLFLFSMLPSQSSFLHTHIHTLSLSLFLPPLSFYPRGHWAEIMPYQWRENKESTLSSGSVAFLFPVGVWRESIKKRKWGDFFSLWAITGWYQYPLIQQDEGRGSTTRTESWRQRWKAIHRRRLLLLTWLLSSLLLLCVSALVAHSTVNN